MTVNVLVSFGVVPGADLAGLKRDVRCGRVMVDSGAFSVAASGHTITLGGYAAHLERWRGAWDHAITLDVVGDPAATAANTRRLHEQGLPVLPVFTLGGRLGEFDAMVTEVGYVAVGGLVGLGRAAVRARLTMLQRRARERGGGIHALGNGSMTVLRAAAPYSSDVSSVSSMYRWGTLAVYDGVEVRAVAITDRAGLMRHRDALGAQGIAVAPLLRAGRLPAGAERQALTAAMCLAYVCADADLKRRGRVPAPVPGVADGPHVYMALGRNRASLLSPADVAAAIHSPSPPRAWARYGRGHTCQAATPPAARAGVTG